MYGGNPYEVPPPVPPPAAAGQHQSPPQGYYGAMQASQAAFNQNAQVSGLGISVDSPSGQRSPNAVGGDLSWSELFPTSNSAPPPPLVQAPYNPPAPPQAHSQQYSYHQHQHQHHPPPPAPVQQVPPQPAYTPQAYTVPPVAPKPAAAYNPEVPVTTRESEPEEGELSEDMDDDLYEPEEASGPAESGDARTSRSAASQEAPEEAFPQAALGQVTAELPSRDASVIDTQEDAFYDEDDDNEPAEAKSSGNGVSASEAADADDEDMGYSDSEPKSVEVVEQERAATYSPRLSPGEIEDNESASGVQQKGTTDSAAATAAAAILFFDHAASGNGSTNDTASKDIQKSPIATEEPASESKLPFPTVDDGKKKAQTSILRLTPHVSYQTYIDEGCDGKVVQSLFKELGLKTGPTPTAATALSASPRSTSPSQSAEPIASQPGPAGNKDAPREERKDKIARLLALKASKPSPVLVAKPPAAAAAATKLDKTKSEKGLMLQQKLEALRQAQEQRAAAANKAAVEATALGSTVSGQQGEVAAAIVGQIANKTAAISAALPSPLVGGPHHRPGAADFAELFSSAAVHSLPKRPPPLARQESSMVIDVSDDSDEDVAMELDSQADDSYLGPTQYNDRRDGGAPLYRDQRSDGNGNNRNGNGYQSPANGSYSSPRGYGGRAPPMMPAPPTAPASMLARAKDDEYSRKMRQIEEMKRKIAEAEARKAAGSSTPKSGGNRTPSDGGYSNSNSNNQPKDNPFLVERPPPQPIRRITSMGEVSGEDGASSPAVLTEMAPLRVAKRTGGPSPTLSQESHREKRMRVASLQLPRVEASLQEKMFKLRLLQERVAALQAEIDEGVAEKRRLTEDIEDLSSGQEEVSSERDASVQPPQSQPPADGPSNAIDLTEENDLTSQPLDGLVQQQEGAEGENETGEVASQIVVSDADQASKVASVIEVESDADDKPSDAESDSDSAAMSDSPGASDDDGEIEVLDDESNDADEEAEEKDGGVGAVEDAGADAESNGAVDAVGEDAVAELFHDEPQGQTKQHQQSSSAVVKPATATAKPATTGSSTALPATFVSYESPLQYFESYRFHPQYKAQVPGGFRSLTYSGRIQDDIELCPNELLDGSCSVPTCTFQHFDSIVPKDDQILVELGRSDDYTGDQKSRFVDGLKDLLKKFRDNQERDFDRIAEGIIDFRRSFLGDDSRVLAHLEGITV
ncbi:hypothetical protein Sste5346_005478 [Sporothrix stenoceras]|uniref:Zinc-finger domain-containing protein n=1 Tax=Sporothrix stenoceras TaxID=5173 RepID=A0ABR3Z344_9PEZI